MTAEQTRAALRASTEAQARVKRENALHDTLQALHLRLMECSKHPILVFEAYDSFYQAATLEALEGVNRRTP